MERLIYKPELLKRIGCSYPTLWKWMRNGKFTKALVIEGRIAWPESEIDEWFKGLPHQKLKPVG